MVTDKNRKIVPLVPKTEITKQAEQVVTNPRKWVYSRGYGAPISHCLYQVADGFWHAFCGTRRDLEGHTSQLHGLPEEKGMQRCALCQERIAYHDGIKRVSK